MGQSIEEVLNRLVAVEDAAQQMQDAVDAQKKELAAQMEEKKKQFDSMLELKTEQNWKQTWSTRRQPRWNNSGRKRKNSLPECSTSMIQSTTGFRMKFCSP